LAITSATGGTSGVEASASGDRQLTIASSPQNKDGNVRALLPSRASLITKPKWHAPWKLYRVISGHTGWARAIDVEPNNEWFVSGGADRIIKASEKYATKK
jgi:pleiotropic regulator 1